MSEEVPVDREFLRKAKFYRRVQLIEIIEKNGRKLEVCVQFEGIYIQFWRTKLLRSRYFLDSYGHSISHVEKMK